MEKKRYLEQIQLTGPVPRGSYLGGLPAVQALARAPLDFPADVTFFVGENGSGKSTLLEAIAVAAGFNPEGGSRSFHFSTAATHSSLHQLLLLRRGRPMRGQGFFLRAESLYNVATNIDALDADGMGPRIIDAYGGISLHEQSHGESFFALMCNRFRGQGLYLLDEPEAALSPARQMAALVLLHQLAQQGAQFIIATHSPILLAIPGACIYQFDEGGLHRTAYRDTMPYQLTRRFLDDPEGMLDKLLRDDAGAD